MIRDLEFPVLGYHGTNLAAAKKILRDGFRPSTNKYDWLGRGVFLEGKPIFPDSALYNKGHAQIAIRDLTLIEQSKLLNEGEN